MTVTASTCVEGHWYGDGGICHRATVQKTFVQLTRSAPNSMRPQTTVGHGNPQYPCVGCSIAKLNKLLFLPPQ